MKNKIVVFTFLLVGIYYPANARIRVKQEKVKHDFSINKGNVKLHFALPYINFMRVQTSSTHISYAGCWGLETGADYFYKKNKFISLQAGSVANDKPFLPFVSEYDGHSEASTITYINVRNNYCLYRFNLGYGISLAKIRWEEFDIYKYPRTTTLINNAIGASLSAAYRFKKSFQIGLLYQPFLWMTQPNASTNFQQQFSIEFIWKAKIIKR